MKYKKITGFILALVFSFLSIAQPFLCVQSVHASGIGQITQDFAERMAYAYCSLIGAVNATANGVSKASGNLISALTTKISDLWGTGIYEDANGNIVWSGEATQDFYETLLGQNDIDARAVSTFYGTTPYRGLYGLDSAYFNHSVRNFANSGRTYFTDYLAVSSWFNDGRYYYSKIIFYDLSNVAYIVASGNYGNPWELHFYNSSGSNIRVDCKYKSGNYDAWNGNFSSTDIGSSSSSYCYLYGAATVSDNGWGVSLKDYVNNMNLNIDNGEISCFDYFPFISSNSSCCWSNKTIILGSDSAHGLQKYNQNTGIIVNNEYNVMPSISRTDIENNNWKNIYNNYVTNVQNEGDTYITENGIDPPELRKVIKKYTDVITDAIEEGNTDIENVINYTNEWLKKIYERLGLIYDKMDNLDSGSGSEGGSSCPWSDEDIQSILDGLDRIDSNLALELSEMQKIYTYLGTLLEAIQDIESGGDGKNITTIIPIITDLPDTDVLDFIDTGDILADLAQSVVPFCFVAFVVGLADKLAAEPVTPSFSIPFKLNSEYTGVNIDESIDIDFADFSDSGFDFIHGLVTAAWCISWIIMLVWLTFNLLESFNLIFG